MDWKVLTNLDFTLITDRDIFIISVAFIRLLFQRL
jgi:hypothetical protein